MFGHTLKKVTWLWIHSLASYMSLDDPKLWVWGSKWPQLGLASSGKFCSQVWREALLQQIQRRQPRSLPDTRPDITARGNAVQPHPSVATDPSLSVISQECVESFLTLGNWTCQQVNFTLQRWSNIFGSMRLSIIFQSGNIAWSQQ